MFAGGMVLLAQVAPTALASCGNPPHCKEIEAQCLNALFNHGAAKRDCSAFYTTTVVPCPVIATETFSRTVTARPETITSFFAATSTDVVTSTSQITSDQTDTASTTTSTAVTDTISTTTTQVTTVATTSTILTIITSTVTVTTSIVTTTNYVAPATTALAKRHEQCSPYTIEPGVPHYAECCGSPSVYSSACSCVGSFVPSTVTLSVQTYTKPTEVLVTVTPTITESKTHTTEETETQVITVYTTLQSTSTVTATITATDFITLTNIISSTDTSTEFATSSISTTGTTTQTASVTLAACPLQASDGPNAGQYLAEDTSNSGLLHFTSDLSSALDFALDGSSRLVATNRGTSNLLVLALPSVSSFVPLQGTYQPGDDGTVTLICNFDAALSLSCVPNGGGPNDIWLTEGNSFLIFGEPSDIVNYGYEQITLVSICQNPA